MIHRNDILAFDFYKKSRFTGSYLGMHYQIAKKEEADGTVFCVTTWPGPYNFESTEDSLKSTHTFPFAEESLSAITDYLNEMYEKEPSSWPTRI